LNRSIRRSGLSLILAGLAGIVYFWLTDPRYGLAGRSADNVIDAANQAFPGTVVGITGSALVLATGLWLLRRRSV